MSVVQWSRLYQRIGDLEAKVNDLQERLKRMEAVKRPPGRPKKVPDGQN